MSIPTEATSRNSRAARSTRNAVRASRGDADENVKGIVSTISESETDRRKQTSRIVGRNMAIIGIYIVENPFQIKAASGKDCLKGNRKSGLGGYGRCSSRI